MRMIDSSDAGAVARDQAMWLLRERVVLTTSVCRELRRCNEKWTDQRARAALDLLRRWIAARYEIKVETHASDGLDQMVVPPEGEALMTEIRIGSEVCEALAMLWTADTQGEFRGDSERIAGLMATYPYVVDSEVPGSLP